MVSVLVDGLWFWVYHCLQHTTQILLHPNKSRQTTFNHTKTLLKILSNPIKTEIPMKSHSNRHEISWNPYYFFTNLISKPSKFSTKATPFPALRASFVPRPKTFQPQVAPPGVSGLPASPSAAGPKVTPHGTWCVNGMVNRKWYVNGVYMVCNL